MKFTLLLAFAFILNIPLSFAGNGIERFVPIDFEKATEMSIRSQQKLQSYLKTQCQPAASTASGLSVKLVNHETVRVDQGVIDEIYTIHVIFHGWDQYEHELAVLKVTDFAGNNPAVDWVQIEKLETSMDDLCK